MLQSLRHAYRLVQSNLRERRKAKERSPAWGGVRDRYLRAYPTCAACGGNKRLQVHHIIPFHLFPEKELDLENLITLCMSPLECHIRIGHGDDFQCYNPDVKAHVKMLMRADGAKRPFVETMSRMSRLKDR